MKQVLRGLGAFLALELASVLAALTRGGGLTAYLDISFLVGLAALVFSGFYYLSGQKAFAGVGASLKKMGFAIVELFSSRDFTEQRRKLHGAGQREYGLQKDCEFLVASALILLLDFAIIYCMF